MQSALLAQLRAAARAEIAKAPDTTTTTTTTTGWAPTGNLGDILTWALRGRAVLDPEKIYADARRAFAALETLLAQNTDGGGGAWFFNATRPTLFDAHVFSYTHLILDDDYHSYGHDDIPPDGRLAELAEQDGASTSRPRYGRRQQRDRVPAGLWGDETLRMMVRDCPRLVKHAQTMLRTYWPEEDEEVLSASE